VRETNGGVETFTFSFRLPQSPIPAFEKPRKRRRPANEKRRARDRRRREAWLDRRNQSSQPGVFALE
jgi:hypothetical protein